MWIDRILEMDIDISVSKMNFNINYCLEGAAGSVPDRPEPGRVSVSLREMWEIYIKAVKSTDKSADNMKVCYFQYCWPQWLNWMCRPTGDQEIWVQPPPRSATFFHGDRS